MRTIALALLALDAAPAAAAARPAKAQPVGDAQAFTLLADRGVAAFQEPSGALRLLDDDGRGGRVGLPGGCRAVALRMPWVLVVCADGVDYQVFDVNTGSIREVPRQPEDAFAGSGYPGYQAIGASWVAGRTPSAAGKG